MSNRDIENAINSAVAILRKLAPYDTGNLRYNAIKIEHLEVNKWRIYVDEKVAPYMVYTNEEWTSTRCGGAKNPNEGWFDNAAEFLVGYITSKLNGEVKRS